MNAIATSETSLTSRSAKTRHSLEVFRRAHFGRWPTLRAYSVRRHGSTIYEVAKWLRMRADKPYCVLVWNLAEISMRWHDFRTLAEARKYLHTFCST